MSSSYFRSKGRTYRKKLNIDPERKAYILKRSEINTKKIWHLETEKW